MGFYTLSNETHGYVLTTAGFITIDFPDTTGTIATGINEQCDIVGQFVSKG